MSPLSRDTQAYRQGAGAATQSANRVVLPKPAGADTSAARSLPVGGHQLASGAAFPEIATGGTLFANALAMAACRATLTEGLTPQALRRPAPAIWHG